MTPTLLFDPAPLAPAVARGAVVLTPNRRLASRIRLALAADVPVRPAAPVYAIGDWIDRLWLQLVAAADPLAAGLWVLSPAQELALWEQAVRAGAAPLLRPGQAAELAQAAYRTLALWEQLPLAPALRDECAAQPDSALLLDWIERFEHACGKRAAIAAAERDRRVAGAARARRLSLPERVMSVGFDDMPPLYRALLRGVEDHAELELPSRRRHAVSVGFDSPEKQLQAAALWARRELERNPAGPVAIVVPDLNQQRTFVERVLLDVLTPAHALPQTARALPPLNFSAGEALAQTPLVTCALQLLELAAPAVDRETLLSLLLSPFHGFAEADGRGFTETDTALVALHEHICALRTHSIRAGQLRQCADALMEGHPGWSLPDRLHQLAERARRERWHHAKYPARDWARIFAEILALCGWPGTRTLDSIEYQQHAHWQQLLIEFARYDQVGAPLEFARALQRLRQLAQAQVFQAQSRDTPLQVLGLLEAAGLRFRSLWLCDMGDDRWPAAAAPNPLLPRDLQRRLRMPRCDAEREFEIAQRLTRSLLASAETIVVSYRNESDEVARRISSLFADLPAVESAALWRGDGDDAGGDVVERLPATARRERTAADFALETFAAGAAPVLAPGEIARGGSALFKDQAACPFRAFATHRLGAYALDEPVAGLDAAERGSILHAALEYLWRELLTQEALLALDDAAQQQAIARATAAALHDFGERNPQRLGPRFTGLEQRRLAEVLNAWLAVERERGEFSVVAFEEKARVDFAGLPLRLRVDRIDRLRDGRFLIIDYKTKNANCTVAEWLGERPDEPQLPLYAQMLNLEKGEVLAGIAFAQVRPQKPQLVGVGAIDEKAFTLPDRFDADAALHDWDELRAHWRAALENLALEFIAGRAVVEPKARNTCAYCELDAVCRIGHEAGDDDIATQEAWS